VNTQETLQTVAVIGAGLDLGAGRRGVDMGPSAIRYAGLKPRIEELGRRCLDWGDVMTAVPEASAVGDERVRFLAQIKETCERIADNVAHAVKEGFLPLVLGGDHSVALGTLGGLARASGPGGVLWLDADLTSRVETLETRIKELADRVETLDLHALEHFFHTGFALSRKESRSRSS
jgi:arginase